MPLRDANGLTPDLWVRLSDGQVAPKGAKVIVPLARLREKGFPEGAGAVAIVRFDAATQAPWTLKDARWPRCCASCCRSRTPCSPRRAARR